MTGNIDIYEDFNSRYVAARTVRVWTPSDYDQQKKYDVMYMHDGQVHLKDEVREIIVEKITNDSTIKLVQISADPQTPMGVIEDIKAQLQGIPDIRLFYVLKDIAMLRMKRKTIIAELPINIQGIISLS